MALFPVDNSIIRDFGFTLTLTIYLRARVDNVANFVKRWNNWVLSRRVRTFTRTTTLAKDDPSFFSIGINSSLFRVCRLLQLLSRLFSRPRLISLFAHNLIPWSYIIVIYRTVIPWKCDYSAEPFDLWNEEIHFIPVDFECFWHLCMAHNIGTRPSGVPIEYRRPCCGLKYGKITFSKNFTRTLRYFSLFAGDRRSPIRAHASKATIIYQTAFVSSIH